MKAPSASRSATTRETTNRTRTDKAQEDQPPATPHAAAEQAIERTLRHPHPTDTGQPVWAPGMLLQMAYELRGDIEKFFGTLPMTQTEKRAVLRAAAILMDPALHRQKERVPLPTRAPKLWSERDTSLKLTPAEFTQIMYEQWIGRGLTRRHLNDLDPQLYRALSVWESRHPDRRLKEIPTLKEETDAKVASLADELSPEDLRKIGTALHTRYLRDTN